MSGSQPGKHATRLIAALAVRRAAVVMAVGVLLLSGLRALPATAAQGGLRLLVTGVMDDVNYSDLGDTIVQRTGEGLTLRTTGLRASAVLSCEGNLACLDRGLDGASVTISQSVGMLLNGVGGSGVLAGGRTAGVIEVTTATGSAGRVFHGSVSGRATCEAVSCDVELAIRALTARGNTLTLNLVGTFDRATGEWTGLSGHGQFMAGGYGATDQ